MNPQPQRIAIGMGIHTAEWLVSTRAGQQLLKESHGTDRRPRCMCQPGGVEMYVGRRGQIFYLSRMPGSGFLHAANCASVEDNTLLSGALSYAPGAIIEGSDGSSNLPLIWIGATAKQPPHRSQRRWCSRCPHRTGRPQSGADR